jgi:hypothetical protein
MLSLKDVFGWMKSFQAPTGKKKRKVQPQNNIHKTLKERANESLAPAFFLDILINIF